MIYSIIKVGDMNVILVCRDLEGDSKQQPINRQTDRCRGMIKSINEFKRILRIVLVYHFSMSE